MTKMSLQVDITITNIHAINIRDEKWVKHRIEKTVSTITWDFNTSLSITGRPTKKNINKQRTRTTLSTSWTKETYVDTLLYPNTRIHIFPKCT